MDQEGSGDNSETEGRINDSNQEFNIHTVGALAVHNSDMEELEPGERLVTVVRKHPIGIFGIYLEMFVGVVAVIALLLLTIFNFFSDGSKSSKGLIAAGAIFVVGLLIFFLLVANYVYKKSRIIVTDRSVVQVLQKAPFNRKISRLSMSNVEDVNVEQKGILPSLFNYGTLTIQTAGQEDNFVFGMCPNPDYYASEVLEARQAYVRQFGEGHHEEPRG